VSNLKEKAQRAAAESWGEATPAEVAAHTIDPPQPARQEAPVPLVPIAELAGPTSDDPPPVTVFVAWARVMRDVEAVGKNSQYNAAGTRYNFRGVDAMINAFGPACRRHGVIVMPTAVQAEHGDATTSNGKATRETTVVVSWRIYGPNGDHMDGASAGESLDSSDKGTAKAPVWCPPTRRIPTRRTSSGASGPG
jgi:ERF superfamily protein